MIVPINFTVLYNRLRAEIYRHGFQTVEIPLPPPNTGSFDGLTIQVDPVVSVEVSCFLLLHLFGHSVQWVAPEIEAELYNLQNETDQTRFMAALKKYELDGARYGLTILQQIVGNRLNDWYGEMVAADWDYVEEYYRTGQVPVGYKMFGSFKIEPTPIPRLVHRKVEVRYAF